MKTISFQKWQGAGNDFIIIDNRTRQLQEYSPEKIRRLCDRHFGIGADGLMMIGHSELYDFEMVYFNSDGLPAEMCGNGGRCIAAMAASLGVFQKNAVFLATDGLHQAELVREGWIRLNMADINSVRKLEVTITADKIPADAYFLNTGVPHLVIFVQDTDSIDVNTEGRRIRNMDQFAPAGTNVNFVKKEDGKLTVRTYERGVEAETLACGTGNVAAAVAAEYAFNDGRNGYACKALGGNLGVTFHREGDQVFREVWLEGPALKVFEGQFSVQE